METKNAIEKYFSFETTHYLTFSETDSTQIGKRDV